MRLEGSEKEEEEEEEGEGSVRVLRKRCDSQILLHQRTEVASWKKLWPDTHSGTQTIHTQIIVMRPEGRVRGELRFAMNGTCQDM